MANADIDRFHAVTSTHDRSDTLAIMRDGRGRAFGTTRLSARADKKAFRASHTGSVDQQSHVRGQPEPTWVGIALTIEQKGIRLTAELAQDDQDRRCLPEREQSGHVRKSNRETGHVLLDDLMGTHVPDHNTGNALLSFPREGQIDAGQQSHVANATSPDDPAGQLTLYGNGSSWRDGPGMQRARDLQGDLRPIRSCLVAANTLSRSRPTDYSRWAP